MASGQSILIFAKIQPLEMMKQILSFLFIHVFFVASICAQDTFSIIAIDTVTGEIGSAGASCIDENQIPGGAIIISDILPGRGANVPGADSDVRLLIILSFTPIPQRTCC